MRPRLFVLASRPRALVASAALTLAAGAAMLPAMATMGAHGHTLFSFENAGSVSRSAEILSDWGHAGQVAMWWQLVLDVPFIAGYALLLAGACTGVRIRAEQSGRGRLARVAAAFAWLGPLAGALDLLQDVGLGMVLAGNVEQPWPRIGQVAGLPVAYLLGAAALFALGGHLALRRRPQG